MQYDRHFIFDKENILKSGCIFIFTILSFITICFRCSDCGTQGSCKIGLLRTIWLHLKFRSFKQKEQGPSEIVASEDES